jgi:succinyl-CoA synthetase alpha subunit
VFSNSGNFTTTIAQYLSTEGWGTTTLMSSGKDVYIHYAARDFAHALRNDMRSKAAVLYAEPGGYYEQDAEGKAGRRLRRRALEVQADPRGRSRGRHGRRW